MKRSRGTVKRYVESSESEDGRPLKKSSPAEDKKINNEDDSSSSESDIEAYLSKPEKLDLDSEFFNTKTVSEFEKIEQNIFAGVSRLSDSESDSDKETKPKNKKAPSKESKNKGGKRVAKGTQKEKDDSASSSRLTFNQLQDYTKKIEEAKKHVEIYKAKKHAQENNTDIFNLLAAGEGKTGMEHTITAADLHSSDFESCDSEQDDWEEIKTKVPQEKDDDNLIPTKGLQITVDMPDTVRRKKGVDLIAAMKRRLNRIRKENQVLVHRVHLLCWIAHGNYVSSKINDTQTMAMALSLLPSEQSYPSDRPDLSYLEKIVAWYKRTVRNIEKPVPEEMQLDKCLQVQINRKEAYNKKMLALIFVAILRALGIQARVVMSLQLEPLRPPASELHSISVKESKDKKVAGAGVKSKSPLISTKNSSTASTSGNANKASSPVKYAPPNIKNKAGIKITVQKASPDNDKKIKAPDTSAEAVKARSRKDVPSKGPKTSTAVKSSNSQVSVPEKKSRAKSAETLSSSSKKTSEKSVKNSNTDKADDKSQMLVSKAKSRAKSTENLGSTQSSTSRTIRKPQSQSSNGKGDASKSKSGLKPESAKTRSRAKSTESIDSVQSTRSGHNDIVKVDDVATKPKSRKRAKSTESLNSIESSSSRRSTRSTSKKVTEIDDNNLQLPKTKKRASSSELKGSKVTTASSTSRSKSSENVEASRATKTRRSKIISQVDGVYDSDSDVDITILQLDGANDKLETKSKVKPNIKSLNKTPPASKEKSLNKTPPAKKSKAQPNLKSLTSKNTQKTDSPRKVEYSDSDSDFEPASGSPFKTRLEKAAPDLKKLKNIKRQSAKQIDVKKDIVSLVKGRISEQKRLERNRMANKRKPELDSESDSDYAPEPIKKKHYDSDDEDDFRPKVKVKKRVQVRPVLSDSDTEKKKKKGNDVWVEVFLDAEEKWISVDVVYGQVHCVKEIAKRASHPITYVLAWDNNNNVKDITQRYCQNFNTVTRKSRIEPKWWSDSLKPFMALPTARDREEDDDLARQQLDQPLPKTISEYKDHPLYALRRHLLKFQAIYPPEPPTLGFIRGEAVYPRGCVFTLHSREIWLKQAKTVKLGEEPYKIVKARPKWDKLSNTAITDKLLEIYGPWQVQDYDPPTAENGIVPRNAFGNVDLFRPCMLPKGCVHLKLPGLNRITRRMNIDCASAIVGFDFHGGWSHPVYDGFIVCKEYEDQLIFAWELEQDEIERKEQEKLDKRVYGNWKKLIKGLLIRERLKARYDFGAPSTSTSNDAKKKTKAPTFCTKKK